jgi:hypothetical protein
MAKLYYRITNPADVREMEEFYNALVEENNPKAEDWAEVPPKPGDDYYWGGGVWIKIEPSEITDEI